MNTILHRLIGGLGRVMITVGLLVLAFASFQYWGTGLAEARAQEELDSEFLARLSAARGRIEIGGGVEGEGDPDDGTESPPEADSETPDDLDSAGSVDPSDSVARPADITTEPMLDLADIPQLGEAAGRIMIPAIDVDKTYVRGVGRDNLRKGPGHYPMSAFPGQPGNAAIAGHRTTYGAPFFDLDQLVPGDEIIVETLQGRFTYLVNEHESESADESVGHFIVDPTATWVLDDHGDSRLTLTACHPKRSAAQRIVVTATLETEPAAPTPIREREPEAPVSVEAGEITEKLAAVDELVVSESQSLDESLGWRTEHWPATALWATISALVAVGGSMAGRRWRRLPAYAVSAVPFLACLFVCFTHLDELLPAI